MCGSFGQPDLQHFLFAVRIVDEQGNEGGRLSVSESHSLEISAEMWENLDSFQRDKTPKGTRFPKRKN